MSEKNIAKDGSDDLLPVIDVTGQKGRSITIGIGTWLPPKLTVIEGGWHGESPDHEQKPSTPRRPVR